VHRDMLVWLESLAFPVNLGDLVCPEVSSTMPMPVVKHVQPDHLEQLAQEVRLDQRGLTDFLDHPGLTALNHILDCLDLQVILDFPESWDLLDSPDYLDNHANRVALDRLALQGLRALLDPQDAKALLGIRPMRDSQATLGLLGRLASPECRDILAYPAYLGHQDSTGRMANIAIVHREQHPKSNR
uniref:Single-stranded-DNA-specific exonuclease RecJ n=1 Tax=Globodera pallida TaxID=36090 RepID=A0A183CP14_GLOPA